MARRIDPGHEARRRTLTTIGAVLLAIGVIVLVAGFVQFSKPFHTSSREFFADPDAVMQRNSSAGFSGVMLIGLSGVLLGGGVGLIVFAQRGRVLRYTAAEVAPVAVDTFNQAVEAARPGIAAAREAWQSADATDAATTAPREVVKVKCRGCGYLESEDAKFCSQCAQPM